MSNTALKAKGAIPYSELPYTGQPLDTETVTIGGDVYEFCTAAGSVAADTRIAVVIGADADTTMASLVAAINRDDKDGNHPTLFRVNGTSPALANGRESVRAVQDATANIVYLFVAAKPGDTSLVEGGAASLALSDTATNVGPWKHLNANLSVAGSTAVLTRSADLVHTVLAANLTATQPLKVPLPFAPLSWQVSVRDVNGRLKHAADVKVTVPAAISGQNFLGLSLNAAVAGDAGLEVEDTVIEVVASTARIGYFSVRDRPVRVFQAEITGKVAVAGGTLVFDAQKTAANGTETNWATAVNVAGISAHDPTDITFDDDALPNDMAVGDKVGYMLTAGAGLTTPKEVTITTHFAVLVEATDVIHIHVAG